MSARRRAAALFASTLLAGLAPAAVVEFPGPAPGPARATLQEDTCALENDVLRIAWRVKGESLRPLSLDSRLTTRTFDQTGAELFRLSTGAPPTVRAGVEVALRLEDTRIVASASRDGVMWTTLAEFPRNEFPGEPKLVRLGKMSLKAQPVNNPGDLGAAGECFISDIAPAGAGLPTGTVALACRAHEGRAETRPFPAGARRISCRIDKASDAGMSWGPALALIWEDGARFLLIGLREKDAVFNITTAAGEQIKSAHPTPYPAFDLAASSFRLREPPRVVRLAPQQAGVREADRLGGQAIEAQLESERGLRVRWRAELRDGAAHVRQTIELAAPASTVLLHGVEFADLRGLALQAVGTVPGCPAAGSGWYAGVEMPGALVAGDGTDTRVGLACALTVAPGQSYSFGAVAGVAPSGQLRRAFLSYIERERARPSAPFLHYNCWYDLGYSVDAKGLLDVARQYDLELRQRRGVAVRAFLADDGWDDPGKGLWIENSAKFPGGFPALRRELDPLGAKLAVWISPLGGYGGANERTAHAQRMGLIPAGGALDLAQPAYRRWFEERCASLMRNAGVAAFKWDKAGDGVTPHFMALLDVARALRRVNPEVFINVTVGTWPSPFWLNHVDSTWRNGSGDVGWAGVGDDREQWITFRDGYCRRLFVEASPLYPLNSVMHHGIVHGRCFQGEKVGRSGTNLLHEARSYFAAGASLQELYVTPSMMTSNAWDQLAEAARWGRAHASTLVDAHWVGGDPLKLQPYGYAAWTPHGATLLLRNPSDQPQSITLDAATVFELPAGAPRTIALRSSFADQPMATLDLTASSPRTLPLAPFEVAVFASE